MHFNNILKIFMVVIFLKNKPIYDSWEITE
jgi:hypothetical protein